MSLAPLQYWTTLIHMSSVHDREQPIQGLGPCLMPDVAIATSAVANADTTVLNRRDTY